MVQALKKAAPIHDGTCHISIQPTADLERYKKKSPWVTCTKAPQGCPVKTKEAAFRQSEVGIKR